MGYKLSNLGISVESFVIARLLPAEEISSLRQTSWEQARYSVGHLFPWGHHLPSGGPVNCRWSWSQKRYPRGKLGDDSWCCVANCSDKLCVIPFFLSRRWRQSFICMCSWHVLGFPFHSWNGHPGGNCRCFFPPWRQVLGCTGLKCIMLIFFSDRTWSPKGTQYPWFSLQRLLVHW